MQAIRHVKRSDPEVAAIIAATFPDYTGQKVKFVVHDGALNLASYWEGGSRDYFVLLRLSDLKTMQVPQQSAFDRPIRGIESFPMTPGVAVVMRSYVMGRDAGITIYVHPDDVNKAMLAAPTPELGWAEQVVLLATSGLKPSYRFSEANARTGISEEEWERAKRALQGMGLLNARGHLHTRERMLSPTCRCKTYMNLVRQDLER
jgi:hypothetical protein